MELAGVEPAFGLGSRSVFAWWLRYFDAWDECGFEILDVRDVKGEMIAISETIRVGQTLDSRSQGLQVAVPAVHARGNALVVVEVSRRHGRR